MRAEFLYPKCNNFHVYIRAKNKMSFIWKDDFFFTKIGIVCSQLALTPEPIELCIASLCKMMSQWCPKCSFIEDDNELMLMVGLHAHFLPQQQYPCVCTVFVFSRFDLSMIVPVSFTFFTKYRTYVADDGSLLPKSVRNYRMHSATLPWFSK